MDCQNCQRVWKKNKILKKCNIFFRFVLFFVLINSFYGDSRAQTLVLKDDASCSTKLSSAIRINSLFISRNALQLLHDVPTLSECGIKCDDNNACLYFGYSGQERSCILFKRNLAEEVISRLLFLGWDYGRALTNRMVYIYWSLTLNSNRFSGRCSSNKVVKRRFQWNIKD